MTVYVDEPDKPFSRMLMCHMIADSRIELDVMADKIGVARKWIQYPGTWKEHYDIAKGKRDQAIKLGAVALTNREMGHKMSERAPRKEHGA
jgi:hypothetical protein